MTATVPPAEISTSEVAEIPSADPAAHTEPASPAAPGLPETLRCVARQPILDARGRLHAYELLFRGGPTASIFSGDGDAATRTMLDNTLIFGMERLTGGVPAFVNCTQESLEKKLVMVLPPHNTVLELLETLQPTGALLKACLELKAQGYKIALDDFEWKTEWAPFVKLADYIKVDLSITTPRQRARIIEQINPRKTRLLAERVETQAELRMAIAEGFVLFQGYYFCRPILMQNRAVPANHLVHLELMKALHSEPLDVLQIKMLVKRDPSLTYRLLLLVNSPLYGAGTEIRSILQALVLIGDDMFRRVAMLAIASQLRGEQSSELLRMAFARARFCELAAPLTGQDGTEQYLLGVLSLLPAMLRVPMENIVKALPLRPEMRAALLGEKTAVRAPLEWLIARESGEWERCDAIAHAAGWPVDGWSEMYTEALLWAEANLTLAA